MDCCTRTASPEAPRLVFHGVGALLFVASTAVTIVWCGSMSDMRGMSMPGGWTMSMAWMRMPGQSWLEAAAVFVGMWSVMMVAMMLPALLPVLARYRRATGKRTWLVGAGYYFAWILLGVAIFPAGVALAELEMRVPVVSRAVPIAAGAVLLLAGIVQLGGWKARHLACCRELPVDVRSAWRHGLRLGIHCIACCSSLTAVLLVSGVMDLGAMGVVTLAITLERLAPRGQLVARGIGVLVVAAGLWMLAGAAGFGGGC